MASYQFQTIHTLAARSNLLLEVTQKRFNLSDPGFSDDSGTAHAHRPDSREQGSWGRSLPGDAQRIEPFGVGLANELGLDEMTPTVTEVIEVNEFIQRAVHRAFESFFLFVQHSQWINRTDRRASDALIRKRDANLKQSRAALRRTMRKACQFLSRRRKPLLIGTP